MILDVERRFGQEPGWFARQPAAEQARLLAYRRVLLKPSKDKRKRGRKRNLPAAEPGGRR